MPTTTSTHLDGQLVSVLEKPLAANKLQERNADTQAREKASHHHGERECMHIVPPGIRLTGINGVCAQESGTRGEQQGASDHDRTDPVSDIDPLDAVSRNLLERMTCRCAYLWSGGSCHNHPCDDEQIHECKRGQSRGRRRDTAESRRFSQSAPRTCSTACVDETRHEHASMCYLMEPGFSKHRALSTDAASSWKPVRMAASALRQRREMRCGLLVQPRTRSYRRRLCVRL